MNFVSEELKEGISIHHINTNKYKTNLVTIFLSVPLDRKTVTKNALIAAILRLGTSKQPTQEEINKNLEEMYGAEFNCGIEKIGETQCLKFYIEVLNDNLLPNKENLLEKAIEQILDIAFDPLIKDNSFYKQYINTEKVNLKNIIESKINDKEQYAFDRCIEEMYKNKPYSVYKYGYVEDLDNITADNLYEQYINLINTSKIDIYVSGNYNKENISSIIKNNHNIQKLPPRKTENNNKPQSDINVVGNDALVVSYKPDNANDVGMDNCTLDQNKNKPNRIEEKLNVTQGKLVIGLDINEKSKDSKYIIGIYNMILGASATSKLFQNVREKASLAYSARSTYVKQMNNIYIQCGIEIANYDKAMPIICEQLNAMKDGDFSEDDVTNAKKTMVSAVKTIQDEQDTQIAYFISQELSGCKPNFDEYIEKVNNVTKGQVQDIANKININTIYFLRN